MNHTPSAFPSVTSDQLADVTGGGIGTQIGSMFGADGQKWGSVADNLLGMLGNLGGGGSGGGGGGAPASVQQVSIQ